MSSEIIEHLEELCSALTTSGEESDASRERRVSALNTVVTLLDGIRYTPAECVFVASTLQQQRLWPALLRDGVFALLRSSLTSRVRNQCLRACASMLWLFGPEWALSDGTKYPWSGKEINFLVQLCRVEIGVLLPCHPPDDGDGDGTHRPPESPLEDDVAHMDGCNSAGEGEAASSSSSSPSTGPTSTTTPDVSEEDVSTILACYEVLEATLRFLTTEDEDHVLLCGGEGVEFLSESQRACLEHSSALGAGRWARMQPSVIMKLITCINECYSVILGHFEHAARQPRRSKMLLSGSFRCIACWMAMECEANRTELYSCLPALVEYCRRDQETTSLERLLPGLLLTAQSGMGLQKLHDSHALEMVRDAVERGVLGAAALQDAQELLHDAQERLRV